jgi:hypothetical protein
MKRVLLACAIALALAAPASADTLGVLMKNTLTVTDAKGGVTSVWLSDDGRLSQVDPAGMQAAGFWAMEEQRLCWTARGKSRICIPLEADRQVGDRWDVEGPTGQVAATLAILEGRGAGQNGAEKAE